MQQLTNITLVNKLRKEKRDINVYHQGTRSAHIISSDSSISFPLGTVKEDDYLHISLVRGPGNMWLECVVDVPFWADFELSHEGHATMKHRGRRVLVIIPPGPPTWQIKLTRPRELPGIPGEDQVRVGDLDATGHGDQG